MNVNGLETIADNLSFSCSSMTFHALFRGFLTPRLNVQKMFCMSVAHLLALEFCAKPRFRQMNGARYGRRL